MQSLAFRLSAALKPVQSLQNFVFTVAEAQLNRRLADENGRPTPLGEIFDRFDVFFLCCFSVELLLNIIGHWFR